MSASAPFLIAGSRAIAKKRMAPPMMRNANVVATPRLKPRRVKILISGSIEKARNPSATSHTIVSRTSQMPMRSAITPRTTATTSSVVVTKNRRLGRPVGMSRNSPIEAIAD